MTEVNNVNAASSKAAAMIPDLTLMDIADQVEVMRLQEESTYKCNDFFGETDSNSDCNNHHTAQHTAVNPECRTKMCQWSCQIVDYCQFRRETVDIAMSYLDRFLSTNCTKAREALQDKRQYQLAAMTGLYMAIKLHEPMEMDTSLLSEISRGEYSAEEIAQMERTMLMALQWRLNGPTRLTFALHFLALLPSKLRRNTKKMETLLELIRVQTELATSDYFFTTRKQSTAGLACVLNALEAMQIRNKDLHAFADAIIRYAGMNSFSVEVQEARLRLVRTAGTMDQAISEKLTNKPSSYRKVRHVEHGSNKDKASSPVCVSRPAIEQ